MPDASLEPIPLSALQHYAYCPRQCALIHVEQTWSDNAHTAHGTRLHARTDEAGTELLMGVRVERALPLYSDALGLAGRADVVEFLRDGTPFPVEYKSGKRKRAADAATAALERLCDDVQLCAQALCLEEMFSAKVPNGAIFHAASRRRRDLEFSAALRERTVEVIDAVRGQLRSGVTPAPVNDSRCTHCSLNAACMPSVRALTTSDPFNPLGTL
jgi:CRISPR-associated exonuclease Cas4